MDWSSLKDRLRKLKDGGVDREEIKKQADGERMCDIEEKKE